MPREFGVCFVDNYEKQFYNIDINKSIINIRYKKAERVDGL